MEKNEILEASRKENKNQDLYELEINNKSDQIGAFTGLIVTVILYCVTIDYYKPVAFGFYLIYTSSNAAIYLYRFIKLKKKSHFAMFILFVITSILSLIQFSKLWQGN